MRQERRHGPLNALRLIAICCPPVKRKKAARDGEGATESTVRPYSPLTLADRLARHWPPNPRNAARRTGRGTALARPMPQNAGEGNCILRGGQNRAASLRRRPGRRRVHCVTRTTISFFGPMLPAPSRSWIPTTLSPGWNWAESGTWKQNCLRVLVPRKAKSPKRLRVQATLDVSWMEKRHCMSWMASVIVCPAAKSGGSMPGTPPNGVGGGPMSHTSALPKPAASNGSPIGRLTRICRSPRSEPTGNRFVAGSRLELPRRPSTTNRN